MTEHAEYDAAEAKVRRRMYEMGRRIALADKILNQEVPIHVVLQLLATDYTKDSGDVLLEDIPDIHNFLGGKALVSLRKNGVISLHGLASKSAYELTRYRHFGVKSLKGARQLLNYFGLGLEGDPPPKF